jgi:hypothetical protein
VNVQRMTVEELQRASADIASIVKAICDEHREAALVLMDAGHLISEELLARAFGGSKRARKFAREQVAKERARQDH